MSKEQVFDRSKYISGIDPYDKKETLEEGAKYMQEQYGLMEIELRHTKTLLESCEKALEERDKQQERMYSEVELFINEVKDKIDSFEYSVNQNSYISEYLDEWFEQFKKK
jgi:uncharacterized protein YPO0396